MRYAPTVAAAAVLVISCVWGASPAGAQGGGCTPGTTQGDLTEVVANLTQTVQAPDQARGITDTVAEAARQNNVRIVCLNHPTSDDPMIDGLIQSQLQALDTFSGILASNPALSSFLAQNNLDIGRVAIVGADTSTSPIILYVWNRR
jgi:hypothetical protein